MKAHFEKAVVANKLSTNATATRKVMLLLRWLSAKNPIAIICNDEAMTLTIDNVIVVNSNSPFS